jgi:hypothetical protein
MNKCFNNDKGDISTSYNEKYGLVNKSPNDIHHDVTDNEISLV